MGLKKKSKVSAEFNMSSLTDIIFLLLIFFMLTSSLVAPNALNLKFPGRSSQQVVSPSEITDVRINFRGHYFVDGVRTTKSSLDRSLRQMGRTAGAEKPNVSISPHPNSPVESVAAVMDMAMRYNINAILLSEE